MNISNLSPSRKYIISILYFLLCLTLYYVALNILQPFKPIAIVALILGLLVFNKLFDGKIYMGPSIIFWMLSILPFLISLFYTIDLNASLQFVIIYGLTILVFFLLVNSDLNIQKYTLNINYYFSISIMIFTLFSYFLPNLFKGTVLPLLNDGAQRAYSYFLSQGELSGISGQTGTNAFLLSVGLTFLLFKKKNILNIILISLFIYFIILSEKRGILLANGVAYLAVIFLFTKINYKKIIALILLVVMIIIFGSFYFLNNSFGDINEFSSGRIYLYEEALSIFTDNFWKGIGINAYSSIEGINTHNVYIQLLSEVGLVGFVLFILAQLITFNQSLKLKTIAIKKNPDISNYFLSVIYFQIFFFVYSFIGNPLYDYNFFFIYLLLIAPILNTKSWR
ncbi:O-antigen ligase family protein [Rossellomorea marisflavi]|uniref:O-antigen ligase family protein n=1 Tax=Rossellomorea marisflavi TaxID=189381 RepID=UPI00203B2F26|nr:O-antigen ligase family protein [Rossellomorea marisflavi]MCM2604245.1 O-antigen ligase family protein [Rossellomorea marisflavi]